MSRKINPKPTSVEELWKNYLSNKNSENRNKLVLHYLHIVRSVINKLNLPKRAFFTNADLINIGILGLIEAIEKFDITMGSKFESFAHLRIRGQIIDELRRIDWLSREARRKAQNLQSTIDTFHTTSGENPSYVALLEKMNISYDELKVFLTSYHTAKTSDFIGESQFLSVDGEEIPILENYPDTETAGQLDKIIEDEKIKIIMNFLESLPIRSRLILVLYYYENLKFREIAQILEISESRVSQIHSQLISLLKQKFKELDE